MSKLMTDSKELMDFLFLGASAEDTPINQLIKELKAATLSAAEMRACVKWMPEEDVCDRLDVINIALVESWQQMLAIRNEFKDLIDEKFKE